MLCILEVGLFVFGIVTLVKGEFQVSGDRVVTGLPAYMIGLIMMATLPMILVTAIVIGIVQEMQNPNGGGAFDFGYVLVDIGGLVVAGALIGTIGWLSGKPRYQPVAGMYGQPMPYYQPPSSDHPIAGSFGHPTNYPPPPQDPANPYNPPYAK
jgi:hypothetical protein